MHFPAITPAPQNNESRLPTYFDSMMTEDNGYLVVFANDLKLMIKSPQIGYT